MYEDLEAELHDVFWQIDDCGQQEIDSILALVEERPGRILELGCGSGRVMIPLIQKGHAVDGVELSSAMLSLCRSRLNDQGMSCNLWQQDMAGFRLEVGDYDWITIPAFSIQMLDGRGSFQSCLRSINDHLKDKGRLYFSVFLPWAEMLGDLKSGEWYDDAQAENTATNEIAILRTKFDLDLSAQCLSRQHHYQVLDAKGRTLREQRTSMNLRFYFLKELREMVKQAGFKILEVWPDFERGENAESIDYPACLSVLAVK